jgi:hypothetical protein
VDFEGFCGAGFPAAAICLGARYDCPSSTSKTDLKTGMHTQSQLVALRQQAH